MTQLETLDKIHPDLISCYLETGRCDGIPEEIKIFLKQIQWSAEIYEFERNITRAAKSLRTRILAQQGIKIDVRTCISRIYAAINYFSIENNVSSKIWESNFADKFEDLAKLACSRRDYKLQKECYQSAIDCRRRASEAAETDKEWAPVFIINTSITVEDVDFKKKNLKEIARKSNEGFYLNLIDSLPVEKEDKKRLLRDADIQDVAPEDIEEIGVD